MDRRGDAKSREMMLDELLGYDHVTIQCHDNPDADAIASGYGLYCFFRDKGKDTRLLYSGRNKVRKANLMLMVEKLHIPLEYQPQMEDTVDGLLITVDCQYGAGNVTKIPAEEIAVIDHHPLEVICTERMRLQPIWEAVQPWCGQCCRKCIIPWKKTEIWELRCITACIWIPTSSPNCRTRWTWICVRV